METTLEQDMLLQESMQAIRREQLSQSPVPRMGFVLLTREEMLAAVRCVQNVRMQSCCKEHGLLLAVLEGRFERALMQLDQGDSGTVTGRFDSSKVHSSNVPKSE